MWLSFQNNFSSFSPHSYVLGRPTEPICTDYRRPFDKLTLRQAERALVLYAALSLPAQTYLIVGWGKLLIMRLLFEFTCSIIMHTYMHKQWSILRGYKKYLQNCIPQRKKDGRDIILLASDNIFFKPFNIFFLYNSVYMTNTKWWYLYCIAILDLPPWHSVEQLRTKKILVLCEWIFVVEVVVV